jgi:hypothetical protein
VANMCMEFWHEYIARTLQVRRCTAPFSRLMVGTLARSGGRLGGIHTAVVTRGATLSFCSFGHGTASDPVNVTNAVAGAGAEAADRAIVQIKEALHGALSEILDSACIGGVSLASSPVVPPMLGGLRGLGRGHWWSWVRAYWRGWGYCWGRGCRCLCQNVKRCYL